jgi:dTDP-4-dehydrorhamnose 3,5-epimerase
MAQPSTEQRLAYPETGDLPRIISLRRHIDERGWFSEIFREKRLREIGISVHFIQDNLSISTRAGTLRGLHFQRPPAAQAKLVTVLRGRILDVAVDVRAGSPTFGKHVSAEISAETGRQLYVPAGFAHGFVALENDVIVMYKVSSYYSATHDGGIRFSDPDIGFPWPFEDEAMLLSERDRRLPLLRELASPFAYDGHPLGPLTVTNLD